MVAGDEYRFRTLPDYLAPGLQVVFVGINPGLYSVQRGHYFARSTSRFWPAFSASRLSDDMRRQLQIDVLRPENDVDLPRFGFGLTDVVKRPTANAAGLAASDFEEWVPRLVERLLRYQPRVACFHGVTAVRPVLKIALKSADSPALGAQSAAIGTTRLYVVPNPSPANAHFTPRDQIHWYDRLTEFVERVKR